MQLFYNKYITSSGFCTLDAEESRHAVRVLRLREGDELNVTDGNGNLYRCQIVEANDKACVVEVTERESSILNSQSTSPLLPPRTLRAWSGWWRRPLRLG